MLIRQQDVCQLGLRVQKLLGVKHELSDLLDVAVAVLHRRYIHNPRGLRCNQDWLQQPCQSVWSMVVDLHTGIIYNERETHLGNKAACPLFVRRN